MGWGVPGTSQQLSCEWLLLVEPRLELPQPDAQQPGAVAIGADFPDSEIRDLESRSSRSVLGWELGGAGFMPLADWPTRELPRFAVEKLLERAGTQRLSLDTSRIAALFEAAGGAPADLALRVETGWLVVGLPQAKPDPESAAPAVPLLAEAGGGEQEPEAIITVGRRALERYLAALLERRLPRLRTRELRLEPAGDGFDLCGRVSPELDGWPAGLALPLRARLRLRASDDEIGLSLEELQLEWRGRRAALPGWIARRLRPHLNRVKLKRRVESPTLTKLAGSLRFDRVLYQAGSERVCVEIRRAPEAQSP